MHFDEEMGFQFLCPRSTVLSPSDPRPPTVRDTIVVLAGGRHCCIGLGGVGFVPSNEDLAFRDSVCHLMNLFLLTMFKLRQGPVQFLGLFLATEQEEFFLKRPRIWNHYTIVVLAGGRHCCIGLGGVGFVPSNEDLAFRDSVCHLMNLFLLTMFKLRQGPVQFLGLFLATEQEEFFLKRPRIWNHFGSFFSAGNSTR